MLQYKTNKKFTKIYFYNMSNNNSYKHFYQGLTKSLINLQVELERKAGPSPKETANSVGYVVGFVFGKKNKLYLCRYDKMLIQYVY